MWKVLSLTSHPPFHPCQPSRPTAKLPSPLLLSARLGASPGCPCDALGIPLTPHCHFVIYLQMPVPPHQDSESPEIRDCPLFIFDSPAINTIKCVCVCKPKIGSVWDWLGAVGVKLEPMVRW